MLHRKHASVYDVPLRLPHAAGYLVVAETSALSRLADDIQRPYVVVLGGAKVADKIEMVGALLARADVLLIGGAMAVPFLAAQGTGGQLGAGRQHHHGRPRPAGAGPARRGGDRPAVRLRRGPPQGR